MTIVIINGDRYQPGLKKYRIPFDAHEVTIKFLDPFQGEDWPPWSMMARIYPWLAHLNKR